MSTEVLPEHELSESLGQDRWLTEVDHLLQNQQPDGTYDPSVLADVSINLAAAVQEISMPYAVTRTFQPMEEHRDDDGRPKRLFMWLGKCAVEVAKSGRAYHFSEAAFRRVDIEINEAEHSQETLQSGVAQVFISPKMSSHDAPEAIAKQEHLAADDSIRVSRLVTDTHGRILGRQLDSLLVRDVPLSAWVAMLKDPANMFGKAFEIRNEASALSVMELFEQLELPVDVVHEGPVTIVQAVLPYITDAKAQASVENQLERFRRDQATYEARANQTAEQWLKFEMDLANSLLQGSATMPLKSFIISLQHQWGEKELATIKEHELLGGEYRMTRRLAALLEKANQYILNSAAAIMTGNESVIEQMDTQTAQDIQDSVAFLDYLKEIGASTEQITITTTLLQRQIAEQSLVIGGGCPGEITSSFGGSANPLEGTNTIAGNKEDWQWKTGICRIRNCPSPRPTDVGPCHVCRGCQHLFDKGRDPAKIYVFSLARQPNITLLRPDSGEKKSANKQDSGRIGAIALAA